MTPGSGAGSNQLPESETNMATKPLKRSGFNQGIWAQSATPKETVGTLRICNNGDGYRYAKNGATALAVGVALAGQEIAAGILNQACASAHAIGETIITETITAGVAYAENYFKGGYLSINDATGEGYQYPIESSTAVGAAGTSITLTLDRPIVTALVATTSEFSLLPSPWMGVVVTTDEEKLFAGVTEMAVAANYYFWAKTKGLVTCLSEATSAAAVGAVMTLSATSGALQAIATPLDVDAAYQVGVAALTDGVDSEYKPVFLTWD